MTDIMSLDISVEDKVATLVKEANEAGGNDNITVLIIEAIVDEVKTC